MKGMTFLEFVWNLESLGLHLGHLSRSQGVRAADSDTGDDNVSLDDCLSLNYQPVKGVPRFQVETADGAFWAPIAHRT